MDKDNNPAVIEQHSTCNQRPERGKPWIVTQIMRGRRIVLGKFHSREAAQAAVDRVNKPD